jgi:hypothetical protein
MTSIAAPISIDIMKKGPMAEDSLIIRLPAHLHWWAGFWMPRFLSRNREIC